MTDDTPTYEFGPFRLQPARRALARAGAPVALGGRAFDLLALLVERAGEVVSKRELMAHAWPRVVVEESNLRVHVSALRKALGEQAGQPRFIENVAGRGYSFVAPVARHGVAAAPAAAASRRGATRLIGRAEVLETIGAELGERRLLTVVGPGGIGKTSVAGALAEQVGPGFPDGAVTLDLTLVRDPRQVPGALASTLRVPAVAHDPLAAVRLHLKRRELLLVLDNCEHVADAVAGLADELLACAPGLRILATSRESIGLPYERVVRLPPLALPEDDQDLGADALEAYGALALFAERAGGAVDPARPQPEQLRLIAQICRRLDGLPLSIELAAARAEVLGLHGLAKGLDDCLALLSRHRGGGDPRHQTLRAVLDWSYALLAPGEQRLLECLAVYRGPFTLDCARAVGAALSEGAGGPHAELLFNLAAKSLLACECEGGEVRYRMLETTRSYAADRLARAPEREAVLRAHALRCLELASQAQQDWELLDAPRWHARYAHRVADLRAALDWCLGGGDPALGVSLASASSLLWIELSQLDEQRMAVERALPHAREPAAELALQAALGNALYHLNGPREQAAAAFTRAYELARALGNTAELARAYSGLCAHYLIEGRYPQALALGHVFAPYRHRAHEPVAHLIYHRMMGLTLHFCGQQRQARFHAERVYRAPRSTLRNTRNSGVQYDQHVAATSLLARIRWLEGYGEQALQLAAEAAERALAIDHPISLCYTLAVAGCTVALWNGEMDEATRYLGLLGECAHKHALPQWQAWARYLGAVCEGERLGSAAALQLPPGPLVETLYTLAPDLAGPADFAKPGQGMAGWCAPELLRLQALALRREGGAIAAAEALLARAAELADKQGALAWSLRVASTRALLWLEDGRKEEAGAMLAAVVRRCPPGRPGRDLRYAAMLCERLAQN
ncbi:hypothetical protein B0920_08395 [Massilia sp. KIM]|uniref:ATP-binding protein n=1 Tax=Massilia sp. KIM TaxID=1955422 RepID=UPI0009900FCB|nr:winged helix-turn-helix domain-containing protein [Massilia sp. KIM]OON63389.1 hypothetical protein B0920_08395 [Massilia sp. KIM]